jgi:hypothetical protein
MPSDESLIVEPSAGDGAFIKRIRGFGCKSVFYDIEPEHEDIIQQDFLNLCTDQLVKEYEEVHTLGNPPFGKKSSLAMKFIIKAATFSKTISFILPRSFKKETMRKRVPACFHLKAEIDLRADSFTLNGDDFPVPCVFQIWERRGIKRRMPARMEAQGYYFVQKGNNPDLAIRRVGVYAGKVDTSTEDKAKSSHYFIKLDEANKDVCLETICGMLNGVNFPNDNTLGPRSISQQEIIGEYNKLL